MGMIDLVEAGKVPDVLSRAGMRAISRLRLWEEGRYRPVARAQRQAQNIAALRDGPIAVHTADANAQHYMVPAAFFETVLGPQLKYSCGLYDAPDTALADAETAMLALSCARAGVADGMRLLDLGCGWGSLSIYLARRFPECTVTGVSNSQAQRAFIEARAATLGLQNLKIVTADINDFDTPERFDRILSVEMFEHMSNYDALLRQVCRWLAPGGRLFVHYFCHRDLTYPFVPDGAANWMARHFFTGGIMPSFDLLEHFRPVVQVERSWWLPGHHYQRTSNDWLRRLDGHRPELLAILQPACGNDAALALERWRIFFMAVAEMFGLAGGREWGVGHYLLAPGD
jgi:cyclopropane-fatty-acyl-phospholipid synthase